MNEPKLKELDPKYTPEVMRQIAADMEMRDKANPLLSAEEAWKEVSSSRAEWTVEDWEDFYEGISGAFQRIAARRRKPNTD